MKQVIVELPDDLAAELDAVAPAKSRRRSEFIRAAIQRAIWDARERRIEESYRREPDDAPVYFDPSVWEVREPLPCPKPKPRRTRRR